MGYCKKIDLFFNFLLLKFKKEKEKMIKSNIKTNYIENKNKSIFYSNPYGSNRNEIIKKLGYDPNNKNDIITLYMNSIVYVQMLNEKIKTLDNNPKQKRKIRSQIIDLDDKISKGIDQFPNEKAGYLFLALIRPSEYINSVQYENDAFDIESNSFDPGTASAVLQKKGNVIPAQQIQEGYNYIVPFSNVHNLLKSSPIDNLIVYSILKDKILLNKLSKDQIEKTFISSAYSESPFDERIDYSVIMLKTDFNLIFKCCNIIKIFQYLKSENEKLPTEIPLGKVLHKRNLFETLKNLLIAESNKRNLNLLNSINFKKILDENLFDNLSSKEIQEIFDISFGLNSNYQLSSHNLVRNIHEEQKIDKEAAYKIYIIHYEKLRDEQIKAAFIKSAQVTRSKKLFFPEFCREIIIKSENLMIKNLSIIQQALVQSSQINSNGFLADKNLLNDLIFIANKYNLSFNYQTIENIYINITKKISLNRAELLSTSQNIFLLLSKLDPQRSNHLEVYF